MTPAGAVAGIQASAGSFPLVYVRVPSVCSPWGSPPLALGWNVSLTGVFIQGSLPGPTVLEAPAPLEPNAFQGEGSSFSLSTPQPPDRWFRDGYQKLAAALSNKGITLQSTYPGEAALVFCGDPPQAGPIRSVL